MDFYEMSLLQTELKLDDIHEGISALNKSKKLIDDELMQKLRDEKELSAKAKRFKKIFCSCCKYSDYPEYSPAKYGLVPTTPNKVLKDDIVKDDVGENKISDEDKTILDSREDDKDMFDDDITFNEALELCDKLTHDNNDKDKNDKTDALTDDKNEKYDNDKNGNDKLTHDNNDKDKNDKTDALTDDKNEEYDNDKKK